MSSIHSSEAHRPFHRRSLGVVAMFRPRRAVTQSLRATLRMLFEFAVVAGFCGFVIKLATVLAL